MTNLKEVDTKNEILVIDKGDHEYEVLIPNISPDELISMCGDEQLWDMASDAVSKYLDEPVIVSGPEYSWSKKDGIRYLKIWCYLEDDE